MSSQKPTLLTVYHVTEGNHQVTPLKKLPFRCEFPTPLFKDHSSDIVKVGCYLVVPLVLPKA